MKFELKDSGVAYIGKTEKVYAIFDVKGEKDDTLDVDCIHHIHVLDRSGSMWSHIEDLMEDVKKTLDMVDDNDYITVLWFSGAGEYRTVVKCAKASDRNNIGKILDNLKSTVGCTCFSDPIKELQTIIDETIPMCSTYNVTIFTDGDTVTPWSPDEEMRRIFENLDKIHDKIVAFNAVGYGNYYNRKLLLDMTKTTNYGTLTHASNISEYSKIFSHNREIVQNLAGKRFNISLNSNLNGDIIGLTSKTVKFGHNSITTRLAKNKNTFMILCDYHNIPLFFESGGDAICFWNNRPLDLRNGEDHNHFYALAYKYFEEGARDKSLDILNLLGDKSIIDRQINLFTLEEVGDHCKYLHDAVFDDSMRSALEVMPNSYLPDKNAYCVMDLIKDLVDDGAFMELPDNYQRISRKRTDEFNLFTKVPELKSVLMEEIIVHQDRLNISVRVEIPGTVKLNPNRAKSVGLPDTVSAKIYRNYAVVQDGGLNISTLAVLVSKDLAEKLYKVCPKALNEPKVGFIDNLTRIVIDLSVMPVINASYLEGATAENLMVTELALLEMSAQNKFINTVITAEDKFTGAGSTSKYNAEQVAVLIEHGIRADGVYSSIKPVEEEATDFNVVKEFRTQIKGFSSLPSFTKVDEKLSNGKAFTAGEALLHKYRVALVTKPTSELKKLKELNKRLEKEYKLKMSGRKMALALTGQSLEDVTTHPDGSMTYEKNGKTLVIKPVRVEVAI